MTQAQQVAMAIHLETDCAPECAAHAENLLDIMSSGRYDLCSVLRIPLSLEEWASEHRTARKRAARAIRLGYRFETVARHEHADDIYTINTSTMTRQGRPMSAGYHERPSTQPLPAYECGRHGIHTYGVLRDDRLLAYLWLYRAGELALVSSILGHHHHLDDGIMFLLFAGMVDAEIEHGHGCIVYNRHDSGTDGLRWFKERLGLRERKVAWCP